MDHTYMEIEGLGHRKKRIIDRYRDVWFDHHVESLRQAEDREQAPDSLVRRRDLR